MEKRRALVIGLALPPALAALTVLAISGLTVLEIVPRAARPSVAPAAANGAAEIRTLEDVRAHRTSLSEPLAVEALAERPGPESIESLLATPAHADRLVALLARSDVDEAAKLRIVAALASSHSAEILDHARRAIPILHRDSPLLLAYLAHVGRYGNSSDLRFLETGDGDPPQLRHFKDRYREALLPIVR